MGRTCIPRGPRGWWITWRGDGCQPSPNLFSLMGKASSNNWQLSFEHQGWGFPRPPPQINHSSKQLGLWQRGCLIMGWCLSNSQPPYNSERGTEAVRSGSQLGWANPAPVGGGKVRTGKTMGSQLSFAVLEVANLSQRATSWISFMAVAALHHLWEEKCHFGFVYLSLTCIFSTH